jgi:hypothetical protein
VPVARHGHDPSLEKRMYPVSRSIHEMVILGQN